MIEGNKIAFEYVRFLFSLSQFKLSPANNYFMAEFDKLADQVSEVENFWTPFNKRHVIDTVRSLKLCVFEKLVNDNIGNGVAAEVDNYASTFFPVAFVVDVCNTFNGFFIHELPDPIAQSIPIYLVGYFCYNDLLPAADLSIDIHFATDHYS